MIKIDANRISWFGNPLKMRQIFSNLVSNAIDAFETAVSGDRVIVISLKQENDKIVFCVEDTGCGIEERNLSKIFEPFFSTKAVEKGSGIGLATVKSIVESELLGTIRVRTELGRGSSFTVTFPAQGKDPASSPPSR